MERIAVFIIAGLGLACIYAGYRLFCGLPSLDARPGASRVSILLLNIVPGALLALLGTGLLMADAHGIVSRLPANHRHQRTSEGTSWHGEKSGFRDHTV